MRVGIATKISISQYRRLPVESYTFVLLISWTRKQIEFKTVSSFFFNKTDELLRYKINFQFSRTSHILKSFLSPIKKSLSDKISHTRAHTFRKFLKDDTRYIENTKLKVKKKKRNPRAPVKQKKTSKSIKWGFILVTSKSSRGAPASACKISSDSGLSLSLFCTHRTFATHTHIYIRVRCILDSRERSEEPFVRGDHRFRRGVVIIAEDVHVNMVLYCYTAPLLLFFSLSFSRSPLRYRDATASLLRRR